jgi:NADPH-dependent curcumin reductase CurA
VGDDKKLDFVTKELGFTSGFNYKKENLDEAIKRLAPDGIDIYFDNVGGELLDVALDNMKDFGRVIACGGISQYNNKSKEDAYGLKNYLHVVRKRLRWQGFIVFDPFIIKWKGERDEKISQWIADGSFKSIDHITDGMDNAVEGFMGMLKGENLGKSILKIAEPE